MSRRYSFRAIEDERRVDVMDGDKAVCWLPAVAAQMIDSVYAKRASLNGWPVANDWFEGVLFGIHHALAFGNQLPRIDLQVGDGIVSYRVIGDDE